MNFMPLKKYEVDVTGKKQDNRIMEERHQVSPAYNVIVPVHAPFFQESLVVTYNGQRLTPKVDYQFDDLDVKATQASNKSVYTTIVMTRQDIQGEVWLNYQTYGDGNYAGVIAKYIEMIMKDNRKVDWKEIFNKPDAYPPIYHKHHVRDIRGIWPIVLELQAIKQAIEYLRFNGNNKIRGEMLSIVSDLNQKFDRYRTIVDGAMNLEEMKAAIRDAADQTVRDAFNNIQNTFNQIQQDFEALKRQHGFQLNEESLNQIFSGLNGKIDQLVSGRLRTHQQPWDQITGKPNLTMSWNSITDKPVLDSAVWDKVTGKPDKFPTRWDMIEGKPNFPFVEVNGTRKTFRLANDADNQFYFEYSPITGEARVAAGNTLSLSNPADLKIDWRNINNKPNFSSMVSSTLSWDAVTNKPASFPTNWNDIRNVPSSFPTNWKDVQNKPELDRADWEKVTNRPTSFPSTWTMVANKPNIFPTTWNEIGNKPTYFPSDWDHLINRPFDVQPAWKTRSPAVNASKRPMVYGYYGRGGNVLGTMPGGAYLYTQLSEGPSEVDRSTNQIVYHEIYGEDSFAIERLTDANKGLVWLRPRRGEGINGKAWVPQKIDWENVLNKKYFPKKVRRVEVDLYRDAILTARWISTFTPYFKQKVPLDEEYIFVFRINPDSERDEDQYSRLSTTLLGLFNRYGEKFKNSIRRLALLGKETRSEIMVVRRHSFETVSITDERKITYEIIEASFDGKNLVALRHNDVADESVIILDDVAHETNFKTFWSVYPYQNKRVNGFNFYSYDDLSIYDVLPANEGEETHWQFRANKFEKVDNSALVFYVVFKECVLVFLLPPEETFASYVKLKFTKIGEVTRFKVMDFDFSPHLPSSILSFENNNVIFSRSQIGEMKGNVRLRVPGTMCYMSIRSGNHVIQGFSLEPQTDGVTNLNTHFTDFIRDKENVFWGND